MFYAYHGNRQRASGFSLIELMVGMTLGLLTVIVIMQAFVAFENQKRTTTALSDAQSNGLLALVSLEQAIHNAGSGLADSAALNCSNIYSYFDGAVPPSPAPGIPVMLAGGLAPVVITDGAGGGPDSIRTLSGANFLGAVQTRLAVTMPQPSAVLFVNNINGFADGDLILVSQQNGPSCTVMQLTQVQANGMLQHNPGNSGPYNPPAAFQNDNSWPAYQEGDLILNFRTMATASYAIDTSLNLQLTRQDAPGGSAQLALFDNIVSLQAQYGIAPAGSQDVNQWVDATGEWAENMLDPAHIKRIKAVRVTVVARGSKKEAAEVTANPPGGVNVSAVPAWRHYRYRVYTTIIPLRNVIWAGV